MATPKKVSKKVSKKDGRKSKLFALKASVRATNYYNSLTPEKQKARVDALQAGRMKAQAKRERERMQAAAGIPKARSMNMTPVPPIHETPDIDLGDVMMPDEGNKMVDEWIDPSWIEPVPVPAPPTMEPDLVTLEDAIATVNSAEDIKLLGVIREHVSNKVKIKVSFTQALEYCINTLEEKEQ